MHKNKITVYIGHGVHSANDNKHVSIRIYKTIYYLLEQLKIQNANLESLKTEIKADNGQKCGWCSEDDETFIILDNLFTKVDLLKYHIEGLV